MRLRPSRAASEVCAAARFAYSAAAAQASGMAVVTMTPELISGGVGEAIMSFVGGASSGVHATVEPIDEQRNLRPWHVAAHA